MVFDISLLGSHSTKKGIFFVYHKNFRSYLRTMLFLVRVSLVHCRTHHNHIQNQWLCDMKCHTYNMLHLQSNKLVILSRFSSLKRGVYYQNIVTIRKEVTNMMAVQHFHHSVAKHKLMLCHQTMNLMLNLCIQIC